MKCKAMITAALAALMLLAASSAEAASFPGAVRTAEAASSLETSYQELQSIGADSSTKAESSQETTSKELPSTASSELSSDSYSLRISAAQEEGTAQDTEFSICRVADMKAAADSMRAMEYTPVAPFQSLASSFSEKLEEDPASLAKEVLGLLLEANSGKQECPVLTKQTDPDGICKFLSLEKGLYLIYESGAYEAGSELGRTNPFLLSVPMFDEETHTWENYPTAYPKIVSGQRQRRFTPVKEVTYEGSDIDGGIVPDGAQVSYTIRVTNPYDTPRDVTIEDVLQEGVSFVQTDDDERIWTDGTTIRWEFASVPANTEVSGSFLAKVSAAEGEQQTTRRNTATAMISGFTEESNTVRVIIPAEKVIPSEESEVGLKGDAPRAGVVKTGDRAEAVLMGVITACFSVGAIVLLVIKKKEEKKR